MTPPNRNHLLPEVIIIEIIERKDFVINGIKTKEEFREHIPAADRNTKRVYWRIQRALMIPEFEMNSRGGQLWELGQ
jgi:hypothetical protein